MYPLHHERFQSTDTIKKKCCYFVILALVFLWDLLRGEMLPAHRFQLQTKGNYFCFVKLAFPRQ